MTAEQRSDAERAANRLDYPIEAAAVGAALAELDAKDAELRLLRRVAGGLRVIDVGPHGAWAALHEWQDKYGGKQ